MWAWWTNSSSFLSDKALSLAQRSLASIFDTSPQSQVSKVIKKTAWLCPDRLRCAIATPSGLEVMHSSTWWHQRALSCTRSTFATLRCPTRNQRSILPTFSLANTGIPAPMCFPANAWGTSASLFTRAPVKRLPMQTGLLLFPEQIRSSGSCTFRHCSKEVF